MKNILWLASWYPNKLQPYAGDFIERHARAASIYHDITVLFLIKDSKGLFSKSYIIEKKQYNDRCRAMILYYRPFSRIPLVESFFSGLRYCIFFAELIRQYILDHGKPALLHVQVCWRAGLLGLYCKWRYNMPYAVSEHWSEFAPDASPSFKDQAVLKRILIKKIYRHAVKCSVVSRQLAVSLSDQFAIKLPAIIPNVVDTDIFHPAEKRASAFRFIYISAGNYQKNPEQVFEAAAVLKTLGGPEFELLVYCADKQKAAALAADVGLEDVVRCKEYVPQEVLALEINHSHALILYSRFETFGCVVIEALACGVPVIVSDIPVMHEIVDDRSGIVVPLNEPATLARQMLWMMNNVDRFEPAMLAAHAAERYGFEKIGKMFDEFYR